MRKKRICILLIVSMLIGTMYSGKTQAYDKRGHNDYMKSALFRYFKDDCEFNEEEKNKLLVLEAACYLTIDQFNSYGEKEVQTLRTFGVKDVPDISEITYNASGKTHRNYTHRGWDFKTYPLEMRDKWPKRKMIMLNSMGKVFDFGADEKKKEAFCKLLYYLHMIGDCMDKESYKTQNGLMIEAGGRTDEYDIIHELLSCFEVLFKKQKSSHKYLGLTTTMQSLNSKFARLVKSTGGINSDEKFERYKKHVNRLSELMEIYLPEMLRDETFFHKAFYSKMKIAA